MSAVVLALAAAALWGTGDFFGGLATRRVNVLIVLFWSQLAGLAGVAIWIVVSGSARPGSDLLYAAAAGIAGAVGLGCLYRGMAIGAMGIVAPISATSPIVPLAFSVARGDSPAAVQWAGIALALAGIVLVSREPGGIGAGVAAGVGLALVAALGFGLFVVGLGEAAQESASWAVASARLSSVTVVLLALAWTRTVPRVPSATDPARPRRRPVRHRRERADRGGDDPRLDRDRGGAERAVPDHDDPPRPRRPARATRPDEDGGRADRVGWRGPDRGRLSRRRGGRLRR